MILRPMRKKYLATIAIAAVWINLLLWLYLVSIYREASDIIPLHYSIYFGIDLIGKKAKLFLIPLTALAFLVVDMLIAFFLRKKDRLLPILFIVAGACIQIMALLAGFAFVQKIV